MRSVVLAVAAMLAFAQTASAQQYPQIVLDRTKMMANTCTSLGGRPTNGDRPFTYQFDLTGDGKAEWLLDAAGFGCAGKPNAFRASDGAPLEVFTPIADGKYASAYIGSVWTYRITDTKPRKLFVTLKGAACGGANKTCEKQLVWNAVTKKFSASGGTPATAGASVSGQQSTMAQSGAGGAFSGPAFTISATDKSAAFKAAGFKQTKRGWQSCMDSDGADSASYSPGSI